MMYGLFATIYQKPPLTALSDDPEWIAMIDLMFMTLNAKRPAKIPTGG